MSREGKVFDQTGREILIGDVLKVFHFVGRRNKHHYMYKQAIENRTYGVMNYLFLSHLDMSGAGYHIPRLDMGVTLDNTEIVQSANDDFQERPRYER